MADDIDGASAAVAFGGSDVAVVNVIDGACGTSREAGCRKTAGSSGSLRGGELMTGPFVVLGLVKENGSDDMGGSFAVVKSCWICGACDTEYITVVNRSVPCRLTSFAKLNPAGIVKSGTFFAASSKAI
jgi:hypothetical protein